MLDKADFNKRFTAATVAGAVMIILMTAMFFLAIFQIDGTNYVIKGLPGIEFSFPELFEMAESQPGGTENSALIFNCVLIGLPVLSLISIFEPLAKKDFSKIRSMILPIITAIIHIALTFLQISTTNSQFPEGISLKLTAAGVFYMIAAFGTLAASIFMMILILQNRKNPNPNSNS